MLHQSDAFVVARHCSGCPMRRRRSSKTAATSCIIIMTPHMIASPYPRALLAAALCCAPRRASQARMPRTAARWRRCAAYVRRGDAAAAARGRRLSRPRATAAAAGGPFSNLVVMPPRHQRRHQQQFRQPHHPADGRDRARPATWTYRWAGAKFRPTKLTYDHNNNSMNVSGKVRFRDPTVLIQGDSGRYGEDGACSPRAFPVAAAPGHGSAMRSRCHPGQCHHLAQCHYTSCPHPRATGRFGRANCGWTPPPAKASAAALTLVFEGVPVPICPGSRFR